MIEAILVVSVVIIIAIIISFVLCACIVSGRSDRDE